jgi:hypothetical protein
VKEPVAEGVRRLNCAPVAAFKTRTSVVESRKNNRLYWLEYNAAVALPEVVKFWISFNVDPASQT